MIAPSSLLQKLAVERARSGEIGIRPSERRRQAEEAQMALGGGFPARTDGFGAHDHPFAVPTASIPALLVRKHLAFTLCRAGFELFKRDGMLGLCVLAAAPA
jgi:hypothetical protein